jgi:ribosomal protein S12 methylthiotransferase
MKLLFVSLGCDKNLVDSEEMLGLLTGNGFEIVDDETEAEAIVVNTCCFINDAKEESVSRWQNGRKRADSRHLL